MDLKTTQIEIIREQYFLLYSEFQKFSDHFERQFEKVGILIEKFERETKNKQNHK